MFGNVSSVAPLIAQLVAEVGPWAGVRVQPHARGGTEFAFGKGEIGHIHPDGTLDIPFPKRVRDEVIGAGQARVHHWLPDSGWVTYRVRGEQDLAQAVALLRRAYDLRLFAKAAARERRARSGA